LRAIKAAETAGIEFEYHHTVKREMEKLGIKDPSAHLVDGVKNYIDDKLSGKDLQEKHPVMDKVKAKAPQR